MEITFSADKKFDALNPYNYVLSTIIRACCYLSIYQSRSKRHSRIRISEFHSLEHQGKVPYLMYEYISASLLKVYYWPCGVSCLRHRAGGVHRLTYHYLPIRPCVRLQMALAFLHPPDWKMELDVFGGLELVQLYLCLSLGVACREERLTSNYCSLLLSTSLPYNSIPYFVRLRRLSAKQVRHSTVMQVKITFWCLSTRGCVLFYSDNSNPLSACTLYAS